MHLNGAGRLHRLPKMGKHPCFRIGDIVVSFASIVAYCAAALLHWNGLPEYAAAALVGAVLIALEKTIHERFDRLEKLISNAGQR